ncbi:MAG: glucosaminidase domain-containing protein [Firmicutes bacterium]|nr:glucosaminidase domain-containing protein [Bacillota bacterium]
MARIRVDPEALAGLGGQMQQAAGGLRAVVERFSGAYASLDWESRHEAHVEGLVGAARRQGEALAAGAEALAGYLFRKAEQFVRADQEGAAGIGQVAGTHQNHLQAELIQAKHAWWQARLRGDEAGMAAAHARANHLRALGAVETDAMNQEVSAHYQLRWELIQAKHSWWKAWMADDAEGMAAAHRRANELRAQGATEPEPAEQAAILTAALIGVKHAWWQARLQGDTARMAALQAKADYLRSQGAVVTDEQNRAINAQYEEEYRRRHPPFDVDAYFKASREERFAMLLPYFRRSQETLGIPWQVQAAQWALESGWGGKLPTDVETGRQSYNLFGIKGTGPAGSVRAWTWEYKGGRQVRVLAEFRAYHSPLESIEDHARVLNEERYAAARQCGSDLRCWVERIQEAGYASDKELANKLWAIITSQGWHLQA